MMVRWRLKRLLRLYRSYSAGVRSVALVHQEQGPWLVRVCWLGEQSAITLGRGHSIRAALRAAAADRSMVPWLRSTDQPFLLLPGKLPPAKAES